MLTMKKRILLIGLTSLLLFINLLSFSQSPASGLATDILNYTNKFRQSNGLKALIPNENLNAIAQKHTEDMTSGRIGFGHSGFNQRFNQARNKINGVNTFAENVAFGAYSGKEVVNMWKNSSGHRRNMLGDYKYIGIGTAKDRRGVFYFTQVFAN